MRDGQTVEIPVPTISESTSQSDSQGSRRKPTFQKPISVNSQGYRRGPQTFRPWRTRDRDGQTVVIPVPTFSESTSHSNTQGSRRKPAFLKPRPVDSQASRGEQTLQNP